MRKLKAWAGVALALSLAIPVMAQRKPPARERGATTRPAGAQGREGFPLLERAQQMVNDLKLTDEQKQKISEIFDKAKEEARTMRQNLQGMEPSERQEKVKEFVSSLKDKVSNVLTDEQKQQFKEKMEQLRANGPGGGAGGPAGGFMDRLREAMPKLDLTDEQKAKLKDLADEVRAKAQQAREEADGQMDQMREKMRPIIQDAREKLNSILTDEQQKKLRELMQNGESTTKPAGGNQSPKARGPASERRNAPRNTGPKPQAESSPTTAPAIGTVVPDLMMRKLDGSSVQLSSYKGRILVIEFGSYSSPSFRQRAPQMEQLKNSTSGVAMYLLVYTKEAHPTGGWELDRNKDEKIALDQHNDLAARKNAATKAKEQLKITIPVLLDDMDDSVARAFGAKENSLVIIGKDQTLLARQEWADPSGARRIVEEAVQAHPTTIPTR